MATIFEKTFEFFFCISLSYHGITEVSLHVKRDHICATSHPGVQLGCTSRSCTRLGFASRRNVSADKQGHRYQLIQKQRL